MNPHTKDYRHHAVAGEKTGSPFQVIRRREKVSPWLIVSTILTVVIFGLLMVFLPESPPW